MDLIQEYRLVEQKSRERYRSRMERQYKIVKPDATEAEIKQAIETDQGTQVFANALTQSTRYADARNAYREVQERHEDIKRIAQTMTELQELFNDMAMLVRIHFHEARDRLKRCSHTLPFCRSSDKMKP